MQGLTDAPREDLDAEDVAALLVGDDVTYTPGLELVDLNNNLVQDISDDLAGGSVGHSGLANVHGTCTLSITRKLAWGRDRVRPYQVLSNDAGLSARFNLGVYVLTTPQEKRGEDVTTYEVTGYDLLQPLLDPVGDTYVAEAGVSYLDAVKAAVAASGSTSAVLLDGTLATTGLPDPMVWALTDQDAASWIRVINDLLAAISYRGLWVDENGNYRSEPYVNPSGGNPEWVFDTAGGRVIVGGDWTIEEDVWGAPNSWRFVRRNHPTQPVEGNGLFTLENPSTGASSQASLGRRRPKVEFLDAADQAALEAQGRRIVAADQSVTKRLTLQVDPLPIVGHLDVVQFVDGDESLKAQVVSSETSLDGARGTWVLEVVT